MGEERGSLGVEMSFFGVGLLFWGAYLDEPFNTTANVFPLFPPETPFRSKIPFYPLHPFYPRVSLGVGVISILSIIQDITIMQDITL